MLLLTPIKGQLDFHSGQFDFQGGQFDFQGGQFKNTLSTVISSRNVHGVVNEYV